MSKLIDNYLNYIDEENISEIPLIAAGIAISAVSTLISAANMYKKNFTKAARRCKDLPDREKAICMVRAKMLAKNMQLQTIKGNIAKCNKDKNPEKCKQKFAAKIQKLSGDVKFLSDRFKELKNQKYS